MISAAVSGLLAFTPVSVWAQSEAKDQPLTPPAPAPAATSTASSAYYTLPTGSLLSFVTVGEISSKRVRKGDLVTLKLRDDIFLDNTIVIPAGTDAIAQVTRAEKKGLMGQGGKLNVAMLYFETDQGPVRVSGELTSANNSQTGLATAAAAATAGVVFFVTGKSALIPDNTELDVTIDREMRIPKGLAQAEE